MSWKTNILHNRIFANRTTVCWEHTDYWASSWCLLILYFIILKISKLQLLICSTLFYIYTESIYWKYYAHQQWYLWTAFQWCIGKWNRNVRKAVKKHWTSRNFSVFVHPLQDIVTDLCIILCVILLIECIINMYIDIFLYVATQAN